ncbi:hypothetical protein F9U64_06565 [Gracilibacillus oryzae]|uniref:Uncharacterized protein n=1 Tax=Gracilibacillus oryzae TaxID=1672701 RepID=A0A7C8KRG0_9BACI|nr:hypothetical protein [Gracilibacillus oryzae]KAB8138102.1 hypothetical protein F9U64_06565 [Gracilibacillus oryzae]
MAQLAFSNYFFFAVVLVFAIYISYSILRRFVERNEKDFTREEGQSSGDIKWKSIFAFLSAAMVASFLYLMNNDQSDAIIFFVIFFLFGLTSERRREPSPSPSTTDKIINSIVYAVIICFFIFITFTSTAGMVSKIGAWVIFLLTFIVRKMEKKYLISDNTNSHGI